VESDVEKNEIVEDYERRIAEIQELVPSADYTEELQQEVDK